jgi:nicotinamide-nucleotide adenylyltransferase
VRGLLVGRFQPFHRGHLAAIRTIRAASPREALLLGVGSAQISYTPENPFTAGERLEMILRALAEAEIEEVLPVPLPDIDRHAMWVSYLRSQLPPFGRVYTNNPLTRVLFEAERFEVVPVALERRAEYEGRAIREAMRRGSGWTEAVPPAVAAYLAEIGGVERVKLLATSDRANPERRARPT